MRDSLLANTARLDIPNDGRAGSGIGLSTPSAIEEGCLLAQTGALIRALEFAKQKNQPISRIWIDGGHADTLIKRLHENKINAEKIPGLVLRGLWAWVKTRMS
jgi:pantothenate kinase type III